MCIETTSLRFRHHLLLMIRQGRRIRGYRVLDLAKDFPPLTKEIGYRILSLDPASHGARWHLDVTLVTLPDTQIQVLLEAYLCTDKGKATSTLSLGIPIAHVTWPLAPLLAQLKLEGDYQLQAMVLEGDHALVTQCHAMDQDAQDFELSDLTDRPLLIPQGLGAYPFAATHKPVSRERNSWLKCVFTRSAFEEFIARAEAETEQERSWVATGQMLRGPVAEHTYVTIEALTELPGQATRHWMTTRGRDFQRIWNEQGRHLTAFLHLHPRQIDDQPVTARPSPNDAVVAWDFSLAVPAPCVFPIALFGGPIHDVHQDMDVFAYNAGVLSPIHWEVLES